MSKIQADVYELKQINTEIKRLQNVIKDLRKRASSLETSIVNYLNEKDQKGIKYEGSALILENKIRRVSKSKQKAEEDCCRILRENGVSNPQDVLTQIIESRKGESIKHHKLKEVKVPDKNK